MKLSLASGVYLNFPLDEAIKRIAAAGYDGIDIWSGRPHAYRQDFSESQLNELRSLIHDTGLIVGSFMPAFYRYPYDLSSPNPIIRDDSLAYMKECMDNAAILDAPIVLIVPKYSLYGDNFEETRKRFVDSVDEICRYAQQYDFFMGLEPANLQATNLMTSATAALQIIEELRYDNLGVVIDSGHIHLSSETSQEAVEILGERLLQVHINDNDGRQQQNLVPGEGSFDFLRMIEVLQNAGYDGFLTAELGYQYTLNPEPAVQLSLERMREWLRE